MRTMKETLLWLRELTSPLELEQALAVWVTWYHTRYQHSAFDYRTPMDVEQEPQHAMRGHFRERGAGQPDPPPLARAIPSPHLTKASDHI